MIPTNIEIVQPMPVPVTLENHHRWVHLLNTAIERKLVVHPLGGHTEYPHSTYHFLVSSHSEPGIAYEVAIEYDIIDGGVGREHLTATCSCKAGEFGSPCTHSALALDDDTYGPLWPRRPLADLKVDQSLGLAAIMAPKGGR